DAAALFAAAPLAAAPPRRRARPTARQAPSSAAPRSNGWQTACGLGRDHHYANWMKKKDHPPLSTEAWRGYGPPESQHRGMHLKEAAAAEPMEMLGIIMGGIVGTILGWAAKSYAEQKGKNLAIREDIAVITREVEGVKAEFERDR